MDHCFQGSHNSAPDDTGRRAESDTEIFGGIAIEAGYKQLLRWYVGYDPLRISRIRCGRLLSENVVIRFSGLEVFYLNCY